MNEAGTPLKFILGLLAAGFPIPWADYSCIQTGDRPEIRRWSVIFRTPFFDIYSLSTGSLRFWRLGVTVIQPLILLRIFKVPPRPANFSAETLNAKSCRLKIRLTIIFTHSHVRRNRLTIRKLIVSISELKLTVPVISASKRHSWLLLFWACHHKRIVWPISGKWAIFLRVFDNVWVNFIAFEIYVFTLRSKKDIFT